MIKLHFDIFVCFDYTIYWHLIINHYQKVSQHFRHFSLAPIYVLFIKCRPVSQTQLAAYINTKIIKKFQALLQSVIFRKPLFTREKRDVNLLRNLQRDQTYINRQLPAWRNHATQWKLDILEGNAHRRRMSLSYPL